MPVAFRAPASFRRAEFFSGSSLAQPRRATKLCRFSAAPRANNIETVAIDIIYGENVASSIEAETKDGLWLSAGDFTRVAGFERKPEGFCKGEQCYPVPPARAAEFERGGRYNLAALAALIGQPVVIDEAHRVWCFGEAAANRERALTSLKAPDFSLPDLDGRMHSLAEYRGKKILLVSWASW
jgi:hypothetical protein